jgi:type IV pilus assembly protein PilO
MNKLIEQIKSLNFKDIGGWPLSFKLAGLGLLFVGLLSIIFWFGWKPQLDELATAEEQETKSKEVFIQKKKLAVNLDAYQKRLEDIEKSFGTLLKQLPKKSEMDALLTDINQAGLAQGLQFELFKPAGTETLTEFYAEMPVSIRVTGDYHNLGKFASDVAKLPRIVLLSDVVVASNTQKDKEGQLVMDAVAKTYRYLDEDELAAQVKAKRDQEQLKKGAKK